MTQRWGCPFLHRNQIEWIFPEIKPIPFVEPRHSGDAYCKQERKMNLIHNSRKIGPSCRFKEFVEQTMHVRIQILTILHSPRLTGHGGGLFCFNLYAFSVYINPLTTIDISKLLELIGRSAYILACSFTSALHSNINQTANLCGHLSM